MFRLHFPRYILPMEYYLGESCNELWKGIALCAKEFLEVGGERELSCHRRSRGNFLSPNADASMTEGFSGWHIIRLE